jgi:hypothetical protein
MSSYINDRAAHNLLRMSKLIPLQPPALQRQKINTPPPRMTVKDVYRD